MRRLVWVFLPLLLVFFTELAAAQLPIAARPVVTADDYAHAQKFLSGYTTPLLLHGAVLPTWLAGEGDRFWYRVVTGDGGAAEFVLVDAAKGTKSPAFDPTRVAAALSAGVGTK